MTKRRATTRASAPAPDREARLQVALVALRDALIDVGSAWMADRRTRTVRGALRMTLRLEPVWEPLTVDGVTAALARHGFVPRATARDATVAIRAVHGPSGVELDLALAEALSRPVKRHLDLTLGRGWQRRRPR